MQIVWTKTVISVINKNENANQNNRITITVNWNKKHDQDIAHIFVNLETINLGF